MESVLSRRAVSTFSSAGEPQVFVATVGAAAGNIAYSIASAHLPREVGAFYFQGYNYF